MIRLRRPVRRAPLVFILFVFLVVALLLNRSKLLLGLLFEDGSLDAIHPTRILAADLELNDTSIQMIPKIIHQTYISTLIPQEWQAGQQACLDLHKDYEYRFWTDDLAHTFIATDYPWFLPTYDSYPYPIQRADAIRYFVLAHYGGIYLDLDLAPYRRLDPLLSYPAWACRTVPTGISNDALGAVPRHPFFLHVINSLETYNRNWIVPYITVMYTTGPLFLSVMWKEYISSVHVPSERFRVLIHDTQYGNTYGFFNNTDGGSWHGRDVEAIFWMGRHWFVVTVAGFVIGFGVTGVLWWVFKRVGDRGVYKILGRVA